ncbi:hypothetical protein DUNSADRAFT_16067 [Dunaliella salina]|uniref:Uncharacterized protein n=1 Tax=Dunaliella salina TaxID=3046 RepID=A0ABQ7G4A4_DUNSA|nr:hypothetical protein DUNSADRAFT_16067 [Dunaliella salina]|eukprot:KAF5829443.1 hypothetical protein DUNSADRAFT_16067 [Dunaliella salina]
MLAFAGSLSRVRHVQGQSKSNSRIGPSIHSIKIYSSCGKLKTYAHEEGVLVEDSDVCMLPIELETAALGGALQAAACHQGADVAEYIRQNPTKLSDKVVEPDPSVRGLYEAAFERHVSLGNHLFADMHA